jgi:hypothetical protein
MAQQVAQMDAGLDCEADIIPGRSAAGLRIGDRVPGWARAMASSTTKISRNLELLDLGSVRLWGKDGSIHQIGVGEGYKGRLEGTSVGIGSTIAQVVDALGAVVEDDEDNLVVPSRPGWCFDTTIWVERPGGGVVEDNLGCTLTEIFVYALEPPNKSLKPTTRPLAASLR